MAYKALYRTYRPRNFDEVAGQQHIVKTLQNAVNQNKIAHAYLFCGPRGTGKTSIAKIFAKMINCTDENKPCDACDNCIAMMEGNHPDIIEIDAASNNGVDEVRDLIEKVKYAPLKGKYKVYIIDEVHMMSSGAFNALLKTIEEPPAHVIFIFATTDPQKVLPTIISRCQRYDFTKVNVKEMMQRVKYVLDTENIRYEEEAVRLVCQLADGGMRDALSIMDQVIAYSQSEIKVSDVNDIYGILTIDEKIDLLQIVANKDASKCIAKVNELVDKGIDIKRCTMDLIDILKESVIYDYTKDVSLLTLMNDEEAIASKLNKTVQERLKMIDILMETFDKYRFTSNVTSYFEVCLLNMMSVEVVSPQLNVSRETFISKPENKQSEIVIEPVKSMKIEKTEEKNMNNAKKEEKQAIILEPVQEPKKLDIEFVLSLLVGANKENRTIDETKLIHLSNYYLDPQWARVSNLLRNTKVVASGEQYLVIAVHNQAIANEINEQDKNGGMIDFMEEILQKRKKVFAITNEEQKNVIEEFKTRHRMGTLPPPVQLEEESSLSLVKKLFGETIEIREE